MGNVEDKPNANSFRKSNVTNLATPHVALLMLKKFVTDKYYNTYILGKWKVYSHPLRSVESRR